jgi:hypothetical protein
VQLQLFGCAAAQMLRAQHHHFGDPVRDEPARSIIPPHLDRGSRELLDPLAQRAQDRPHHRW